MFTAQSVEWFNPSVFVWNTAAAAAAALPSLSLLFPRLW